MNRYSKIILITGVLLLIYGYLCRNMNIYFFWDSRTIGWMLLPVALLAYWIDLRRTKKQRGKKLIWVTIGISVLFFVLILFPIVVIVLRSSGAYTTATGYLKSNPEIESKIGNVKGFGLIPTGSVQIRTVNGIETGNATFEMIVRGDNKYIDVTVDLEKKMNQPWMVVRIR